MNKTEIICLCGSTRFKEEFVKQNLSHTLAGRIVVTIGCDLKTDEEIFGSLSVEELERIKHKLDILHLRKIDLSDRVFIINPGRYIGASTTREINYALQTGKPVETMEPVNWDNWKREYVDPELRLGRRE